MQKAISVNFEEYDSINALSIADRELLGIAIRATNNAYAPYSNFKVGVSGLLKDGSVVTAANCENASYSITLCAERVLLANVMVNHADNNLTTLAINALDVGATSDKLVTCCGICRQAILEYEAVINKPLRIIMGSALGRVVIVTGVKNLLPLEFLHQNFAVDHNSSAKCK